jgi:hypothetical protein
MLTHAHASLPNDILRMFVLPMQVLHDVVRSMFDTVYAEKLFTPQAVYSVSSTRKIFEKLAHSSIMRLSESRWVPRGTGSTQKRSDAL